MSVEIRIAANIRVSVTFQVSDPVAVGVLKGAGVELVHRGGLPPAQAPGGQGDHGGREAHQRRGAAHRQPEEDLPGHPVPGLGRVQQQHLLGHPGVRFNLGVLFRGVLVPRPLFLRDGVEFGRGLADFHILKAQVRVVPDQLHDSVPAPLKTALLQTGLIYGRLGQSTPPLRARARTHARSHLWNVGNLSV